MFSREREGGRRAGGASKLGGTGTWRRGNTVPLYAGLEGHDMEVVFNSAHRHSWVETGNSEKGRNRNQRNSLYSIF